MKTAISVKNFEKSYGTNHIIKGISFDVMQGEIFALLGTNGAGKTTTLECIEGVRKYDGGQITVNGKTGVQLQSSSLPSNIITIEAIKLFEKWNKTKIDTSLLHDFGIDEIRNKQYKDLSTGQKRRLHLALTMIGNPEIVFLDEPTAGLDVEGRYSLHNEIKNMKQQGKTIVISSHDMAEVETLCDRIAILKDGKLAFVGTANELTAHVGSACAIHIETNRRGDILHTQNITNALLAKLSQYKQDGTNVLDIRVERATLEERFIEIATEE